MLLYFHLSRVLFRFISIHRSSCRNIHLPFFHVELLIDTLTITVAFWSLSPTIFAYVLFFRPLIPSILIRRLLLLLLPLKSFSPAFAIVCVGDSSFEDEQVRG